MQDEDWDCLEDLGEEEVKKVENQDCKLAGKKLGEKLEEAKEKMAYPFSREYKDFSKKFINETYLLGP